MGSHALRTGAMLVALGTATALVVGTPTPSTYATGSPPTSLSRPWSQEATATRQLRLPDGSLASLDPRTGIARITASDGSVTTRIVPGLRESGDAGSDAATPTKASMIALLSTKPREPYATDRIVVVFRDSVASRRDRIEAPDRGLGSSPRGAVPAFTRSGGLNAVLARLGVDRAARLFTSAPRARLRALTAAATKRSGEQTLPLANTYLLHLASGDPRSAAVALLGQPGVALAGLDWTVESPGGAGADLSGTAVAAARRTATALATQAATTPAQDSSWRQNYGIASSAQSFWNAPGLDAAAAFDEILDRFGELPGTGQLVTEVGIGDLSDANPGSRCYRAGFGPTTVVHGGQRYIDLPSMPLVPTFTASAKARLDPMGEVCGTDPLLRGIGHDLSVMAPLPRDQQRPGNRGHGLTDLLGLAPGARYRVVVPASSTPTVSDASAALLAAATQTPRPDVITTGITASGDGLGFPQRYLEQDPLAQAVITTITDALNISVSVGAGDGVRRNSSIAAFGPSGGAVATDAARSGQAPTTLDDVALSTSPSRLRRSGAIMVGASTQNDIFAAPPHYLDDPARRGQPAYAASRWTGATDFATGYGSRVDLSAPGDSILSMSHLADGAANQAQPDLAEGTAVSAAEVAASVAVVRQVADRTGQPFAGPRTVRAFLQQTSTPVADVPQADRTLQIGGQVDLGRAVEELLARSGQPVEPGVVRFAVAQRRPVANLGAVFETGTNPKAVNLRGPRSPFDGRLTGANYQAWITIAPDWQGLAADTSFSLTAAGADRGVVATTPSARVLPAQLLAAAGLPLHSSEPVRVRLVYTAKGSGVDYTVRSSVVFGAAPKTSLEVLAPRVAPVSHGRALVVRYDLRGARVLQPPVTLDVSYPARANPATGAMYDPLVSIELPYDPGDPSTRVGTVKVPVYRLQGGGIYGLGIHLFDQDVDGLVTRVYSDFAYTRVSATSTEQPPAPLVSHPRGSPGHHLDVGYSGRVRVAWDVSDVRGADGAVLEVSAPAPDSAVGLNTFNNPEGNVRDENGVDSGSVSYLPLAGVDGALVTTPHELGVLPTMTHGLRVLAVSDGQVVGEASPVSTVSRAGVVPVGDDPLNESGFSIGPGAASGYLATLDSTRNLGVDSSVQSFDTHTKAVGTVLAQTRRQGSFYAMTGNGLFDNRVGLFGQYAADPSGAVLSFQSVVGTKVRAWTPPLPARLKVRAGAADPSSSRGAFVAYDAQDGGPAAYRAFTSYVAKNTFGKRLDLSGALASANVARVNQVVYDDGGARGMAGFASNDFCVPPTLVAFDTGSSEASAVVGQGFGDPFSMALDRSTGTVAVANSCSIDLGLYDLDDGSSSLVPLDQNGYFVAVDDVHGLVLVAKAVPPDAYSNHNLQSSIAVYRLDGSYVKEVGGIYLWDVPLVPGVDSLQVDPVSRTAWIFGPYGHQLAPVRY